MARSRKILIASALGVAALALVAASSGVTGAYFSDSHNGSINASTGVVQVNPTTDLSLNFAGLLPGAFQTKDVTYRAAGSAAEDIWLVFPTDATSSTAFLNGQKGTPGAAPALGRYGHFAVTSPAGSFTSFNLTTAATPSAADCFVNANGHGGSDAQAATSGSGPLDLPAYCPVPNAILLSSNLTYGETATAQITFGYTKLLKDDVYQNAPSSVVAPFRIVATQAGILPSDPNNVVR
jgi:hypothetical protein